MARRCTASLRRLVFCCSTASRVASMACFVASTMEPHPVRKLPSSSSLLRLVVTAAAVFSLLSPIFRGSEEASFASAVLFRMWDVPTCVKTSPVRSNASDVDATNLPHIRSPSGWNSQICSYLRSRSFMVV
eukprot:scaffold602498_cov59-Attheya_sp.AAC.1